MTRGRGWQVLSERMLVERHWLRVREQRVLLPNGHEIEEFHLIDSPDWAATLALTDEGNAVLVRQHRHGAQQSSLELPAGVLEAGEDGLVAARRELLEETGYAAREWHPLVAMHTEPARHTTRAHVYVAKGAHRAQAASPDAGELLEIVVLPVRELVSCIDRGEILHWVHVAAILLAARRGYFSLDG
jgi:8-oxo-dGTP pyrophosphatase MutT (NUDIX family)